MSEKTPKSAPVAMPLAYARVYPEPTLVPSEVKVKFETERFFICA